MRQLKCRWNVKKIINDQSLRKTWIFAIKFYFSENVKKI